MDYNLIGQRIRDRRRADNLTQEQLAELVDISVTHMSHIETGSTKLSLPVLIKIANALKVSTDELLMDNLKQNKSSVIRKINELMSSCSELQLFVIQDVILSVKKTLDENMNL